MEIFLGFIDVINDNRFWLGPILALIALVAAAREVIGVIQEEIEDARDMRSVFFRPRPWR